MFYGRRIQESKHKGTRKKQKNFIFQTFFFKLVYFLFSLFNALNTRIASCKGPIPHIFDTRIDRNEGFVVHLT